MSAVDTAPAPLRLPAILQNPTNTSLRQVEAHNAQQREKVQARREARLPSKNEGRGGKGKRVIRRLDNAAFTSNPHIVTPSRSDYLPPVPLQYRPFQPSFPPNTVPRSAPIPSVVLPSKDPNSSDSVNGAFNLSLKGTRALLRKRGRRVENLVGKVENEIKGWLDGGYNLSLSEQTSNDWTIIDDTLIDIPSSTSKDEESNSASGSGSGSGSGSVSINTMTSMRRRLPVQHQITGLLPSLPLQDEHGQAHAILEISRSPAHLSWYIVDGFERLVVHLLARYYELISWSEQHTTISNESIRLTHIVLPSMTKPRPANMQNALLTPETSELSSQSGPDSIGLSTSEESDTATERGDDEDLASESGSVEGYTLEEGETTITDINMTQGSIPTDEMSRLDVNDVGEVSFGLERTLSNTSSRYASSEGEGSNSDYSVLGDSFVLPPRPTTQSTGSGGGIIPAGDWSDIGSDLGDLPMPMPHGGISSGIGGISRSFEGNGNGFAFGAGKERKNWQEKPTFFEYLYGA
ncbi:uncharacterized protein IL334_007049 [Kwoniella shivajii]|uniref:Uncharacterized protein n=1 Tax=Kwoniella shivajii TaxID=564305 RepID=A0ABZ1D9Q1_9TREE|nr:hypothetical protein IL334_007049 [Kwoniella shivajii]